MLLIASTFLVSVVMRNNTSGSNEEPYRTENRADSLQHMQSETESEFGKEDGHLISSFSASLSEVLILVMIAVGIWIIIHGSKKGRKI